MQYAYTKAMIKQANEAKLRAKNGNNTVPFSYYGDVIKKTIKTYIRSDNSAEIAILSLDKKSSSFLYFIVQDRSDFEETQLLENELSDFNSGAKNLVSIKKLSKTANHEINDLVKKMIENADEIVANQEQNVVAIDEKAVAYFVFS